MRKKSEHGRELTLKEATTVSLLTRLEGLLDDVSVPLASVLAEIDSIEKELEERNEWESKVSRW